MVVYFYVDKINRTFGTFGINIIMWVINFFFVNIWSFGGWGAGYIIFPIEREILTVFAFAFLD